MVGAGKFGQRFYHYLIEQGNQVTTLSRTAKSWSKDHLKYDLLSEKALPRGLSQYEKIYFILAPYERDKTAYQNTYIDSITNFFSHNLVPKNARCVFLSATSVFGKDQLGIIDENTAPIPDDYRGKILLDAENNIRKLANNVSVVRASGLYSTKRARLIESLLKKENLNNPKWLNLIHENDLCQWLDLATNKEWNLSIASDGNSFQRKHLFVSDGKGLDPLFRRFNSIYLEEMQFHYPSLKDWLNCQ